MTTNLPVRQLWTRLTLMAATTALLTLILTACNGMIHPESFPTNGPTMSATSNPANVSSADFGHAWGLKVDHGTVACTINQAGDPVLTFTDPDGKTYALNSVKDNSGLPDISQITNGSAGTLRTFAFTVCHM